MLPDRPLEEAWPSFFCCLVSDPYLQESDSARVAATLTEEADKGERKDPLPFRPGKCSRRIGHPLKGTSSKPTLEKPILE